MSKKTEQCQTAAPAEVFEIIEMAVNDVDLLVRAFNVISEVCADLNDPKIRLDQADPKSLLN